MTAAIHMVHETLILDLWAARATRVDAAAAVDATTPAKSRPIALIEALRAHWPEYLIEAAALGIFMISACSFGVLLAHPDSTVAQALPEPFHRRILGGLAMGLTAIALIYSPWGKRSGAHMNPAITFTFFRLGKVSPADALFYVLAQFAGGILGVVVASLVYGPWLAHPNVNYAPTVPGRWGVGAAFAAELSITFLLMTVVLHSSNVKRFAPFTGLFAGTLVATYIMFEEPVSGMSMNPARTLGSAVSAQLWTALWVYFTAPLAGMLLAAELYVRRKGLHSVFCAKLNHLPGARCIFRCRFGEISAAARDQKDPERS
jgi:Glycerol uptake facilitator and related permeases (Major Intrinsic Protein Family)